mmetsp:Transcript_28615/g.45987  ORF Transcript_28615/g.45987 Transcript_28615/m.45987 type:complete len:173 (-) Transcript_28615:38-556(-)
MGRKMFECLVEGCGQKFACRPNRRQHLSHHHKFPVSYRYDEPRSLRKKCVSPSLEGTRFIASSSTIRSEWEMDDKRYENRHTGDNVSVTIAQGNAEMDLDDDDSARTTMTSSEERTSKGTSINQDRNNCGNVHGHTGRGISRLGRSTGKSRRVPAVFSFGAAEHGQEGGWGT